MNLSKQTQFTIAKELMPAAKAPEKPLNQTDWESYIDNSTEFVWKEDTVEGQKILSKIDTVPENFRDRVMASLNKVSAFAFLDSNGEKYKLNLSYNETYNWISVSFSSGPNREELQIVFNLAQSLNAHLLNNGTEIIDQETIDNY